MRFDSGGKLTAMVDRNGNTTALSYTGVNLTRITDAVGRSLVLDYDSSGRVTRVTDPLSRSWGYTYGVIGLSAVTDPLGNVTRYEYVFGQRLSKVIDKRGNVAKQITYDANGRVIQQRFADGGVEQYSYTLSGRVVTSTTITDTLGRTTTKRFNASGYVIEERDALGQGSRIDRDLTTNLATSTTGPCGCTEAAKQYDSRGNMTAMTDRLGQTERVEYEPVFNNVTKATDKMGRVTLYSYDSRGNLTSTTLVTREGNFTTSLTYDGFGELISVSDPLAHATTFEYDSPGNVTAVIDPLTNRTTYEYDGMGRLTAINDALLRRTSMTYNALYVTDVIDPATATTHFDYDENGNQTALTDALQHSWRSLFDAKNRLRSAIDPIGRVTAFEYTAADEMTKAVSPSGRTTRYAYDARGYASSITDPMNGVVQFSYDNRGNLTSLSDQRGNTTTYSYDELFRPISARDPLGRPSTVEYDAMGRPVSAVDRLGRRVRMEYDERDLLRQALYQDATVTYTYDAASRLTRIDDTQSGSIQWAYDDGDRLLSETTAAGVVSYSYNRASQRVTMTVADRPVVNYDYDIAGRLRTIVQGAATFTYGYDIVSRRTSLDRPNGVRSTYEYDEVSRLKRLSHAKTGNRPIEDFQYSYNRDDEIQSIRSLASATLPPAAKTVGTADAANRIGQFGAATYSFDSVGQTMSKTDVQGTTSYQWDARGRLKQVTLRNGEIVSHNYDAMGRRLNQTASGATTTFVYDGAEVVLDRSGDGAAVDYVNGIVIDEKLEQAGALYFLQDHLASTLAITDGEGNTAEHLQYEPFGDGGISSLTRYGYTGRERDAATGLIYYRFRWYDPQQGRFLTEDPVRFYGGLNLYAYVANAPLKYRDPMGTDAGAVAQAAQAAAAAAAGAAAAEAAIAAAPYVAAGAAIGALWYGSWKLGEWIADQPWNRFTHPAIPVARAIPMPRTDARVDVLPYTPCPPQRDRRGKSTYTCIARCHVVNYSNIPNAPGILEAIGIGPDKSSAGQAAMYNVGQLAPSGTYCRHPHVIRCWRN